LIVEQKEQISLFYIFYSKKNDTEITDGANKNNNIENNKATRGSSNSSN
jgi:hypothetical protein